MGDTQRRWILLSVTVDKREPRALRSGYAQDHVPHPNPPSPACDAVVDLEDSHKIQQKDFRELILSMAAADLHGRRAQAKGDWIRCTLESDDEIQDKLKGWVDTLLAHRQ